MIDSGKRLAEIREQVPHGEWGKWLRAHYGLSQGHAGGLINVANTFGEENSVRVQNISGRALMLLARPSTPQPARTKALDKSEAGEHVTGDDAQDMRDEALGVDPKLCKHCGGVLMGKMCPKCAKDAPTGYKKPLTEQPNYPRTDHEAEPVRGKSHGVRYVPDKSVDGEEVELTPKETVKRLREMIYRVFREKKPVDWREAIEAVFEAVGEEVA